MSAEAGMSYQSCSPSGGAQWRGCAPREPWKAVEILATVLGIIVFWPIGLAVLGWKFWQRKSGYPGDIISFVREKGGNRATWARRGFAANNWAALGIGSTGNRAFDEWRAAELDRLEKERKRLAAAECEFVEFMENLRHAKDREEFERFMNERRDRHGMANDIDVRVSSIDEDLEIARDVVAAIKSQLPISSERIKVILKNSWVTLEGRVEWQYQKSTAESAVRRMKGVCGVINNIVLNPRVEPSDVKRKIQAAPMPGQRQGQTSRPTGTSLGQLPLTGKSVLIIEDEALIAMGFEFCLQDAGAAVVKIANSIALAQNALDEGIPFDAAVVDLHVADGNARPLIHVLSERGIPVVITTGDEVDRGQPALSKAVAILQKPHADSDLINAITRLVN